MEKLNSFCRICLENKSDIYSVFDLEQSRYLPAIIFNISGVKILRRNEPEAKICSNCKKAVIIAESIILRCQETEEYFQDQQNLLHINTECKNDDNLVSYDTSNEHCPEYTTTDTIEEASIPEAFSLNNMKSSSVLQCDQCEFNTKTVKVLVEHRMVKHNIDDPNIFSCSICFERFSRKLTLRRHIENVHKVLPEEKKFLCTECGKTYIMEKHLLQHRMESHEPRRFKCVEPNCHQSFTRAFTLRRHYLAMHDKKSRFYCNICKSHFKIYDQWRYHNKVVHKNQKVNKTIIDQR